MAVLVGKIAAVKVAGNAVAEMGTLTLSGFTREALESTAFGDDIKEYTFGVGDGGEVSFSGNYDPTDTNGQNLVESACLNASLFTGGNLRFYINNTTYLSVDTGGTILITKCKAIGFDKSGIGTIEFSGKVSGKSIAVINP